MQNLILTENEKSGLVYVNRVKDTDFGDIFDLSPISVLFTQGSNRDISSIANCDDIE